VRDAGRYDGPLGVLVAIAVAERVPEAALEVIAFADEVGLRVGTAYLGSGAMAGRPPPLDAVDAAGIRLADALPGDPAEAARDPAELRGYCEVHIEQGPVLEQLGEPVGVVTAIAGQTHAEITFTGEAGHAGTVPMGARRDALAAAAELVLAAEAAGDEGLVATVGALTVHPGARNVIPGEARLSLDVRHPDDALRRRAVTALRAEAERIARARGVALAWAGESDLPAVAMDAGLTARLGPLPALTSGAGHDAAAMADLTPVAMLFVRCRGGISHHPAESVEAADVAVAIDVLERFVRAL
jgi:allantoate deiminase